MTTNGALHGLRVLDLTDDTGRFAAKLLAEAGADVVRIGQGSSGPAMRGEAGKYGGLLDWWYDGGKQRVTLTSIPRTAAGSSKNLPAAQTSSLKLNLPDVSPVSGSTLPTCTQLIPASSTFPSRLSAATARARTGK